MTRSVGLLLGLALLSGCARYQGTVEEISFVTHDGVLLHGSLVFPANHVGTVAVVLHGAEAATRSLAYRMHANVLLKRGVAVLLYDKRGAGESGGDHDTATYADLIEDALSAIRWLRSRADIGASSIGLVGTSESGWFTPEIAERAGDMAFVFNKVGSCLTWRETNAWEIHNELLAAGVDPAAAWAQVDVFRALWAHYMSPTAEGKVAMATRLQAWAGRSDTRLPPELRRVTAAYVQDISYSPEPYLERLETPTLYVYGSDDVHIPTAWCVERLAALQAAGRPVSFHIFAGEGHELGGIGLTGYQFAPGYAEMLGDFAARQIR